MTELARTSPSADRKRCVAAAAILTASLLAAAPTPSQLIFEDGFESGTGCAWSVPDCADAVFPIVTSPGQEPVRDGDDADAVVLYPDGAPVVISSGESRLDRTDLRVRGRGQIHFELSRRYRSRLDYDGPLGFGWDFSYNERLQTLGNGDVARSDGAGHVDLWTSLGGGSFAAPPGWFGTLTHEPDGTFLLREPDGFRRTYGANGRLLRHDDRFGNSMLFEYDVTEHLVAVTDAFGRRYELSYDEIAGRRRLAVVRDFAGREVHYSYDGGGDLVAVRGPLVTGTSTGNDFPAGRTELYAYASGTGDPELDHNLVSVTRPEEVAVGGPPCIVYTYGDAGFDRDRVVGVTLGGTNASGVPAGGTATFDTLQLNQGQPPGDPDLPRLRVSVTERNGTEVDYFVNELEHVIVVHELTQGLRPGEPPDHYETNFFFDNDGQLVAEVLPEGNTVAYTYDDAGPRAAQRNLIEIRRIADPVRGGGEDLVTTRTYEPVFNQPASTTDPRGNAAGYVPPLGSASVERYTTRHFYDYQEGIAPIPDAVKYGIDLAGIARGLGDLNGDGRTDQIAGTLVRTEEPTVLLRPDSYEAARLGSTSQSILTEIRWNDRGQKISAVDPEGNLTTWSHHPANDPDGDGSAVPGQGSTAPEGYLAAVTRDDSPPPARRTSLSPPTELETRFGYDAIGNVTSVRDPRGVVTGHEVTALGDVVVTTRGANVAHAVATGQLVTGEGPFGYRERFHYDHNGRVVLAEAENRGAVSTTAGVGAWVERTTVFDILDHPVETTVEADASTVVTTSYRYDGDELPRSRTRPEGTVTRFEFDERDLLFKVHAGFGTADAATTRYDYDPNRNLARLIDAEDTDGAGGPEATEYAYDGFDRVIRVTDALGGRELTTYDVASNAVRVRFRGHRPGQPAAGNVLLSDRETHHDELNRPFRTDRHLFLAAGFDPLRPVDLRDHDSDGVVTRFHEFDALSRPTFEVDDDTGVSRMVYDGASRPVEVVDALGNRRLADYDRNGNLVVSTSIELSPDGLVPDETFTSRFVYDQLDRLVRSTDNAGRTSRFSYDSRDNLTRSSDPVGPPLSPDPLGVHPGAINQPGNTVTRYYDGRDLKVMELSDLRVGGTGSGGIDTSNPHNPDGQVTVEYVYDGNARLTSVVDDNGHQTSYAYDALDRRVGQTNADGTQYAFGYDRDGNLVTVVDPNGSQITSTYDVLNRVVQRGIVRGAGVIGTTSESYGYDGMSRLTSSGDDNGGGAPTHTVDRFYDSLTRLLEEQQDQEPHSSVWSGDGNRLQLTYPTSRLVEYEYDAIDRVRRVVDPFARLSRNLERTTVVADYSWIGPGPCSCHCPCDSRPLAVGFGNSTSLSFLDAGGTADVGYNDVKEAVALRHLAGPTAFVDREYLYNRASIRTGETLRDVPGSPADTFGHDSSYRLTDTFLAADATPEGYSTDLDYTLDGVGNRRAVDVTQDFGSGNVVSFTDPYLVNAVNEYDTAGGGPRSHDPNGNLTQADGLSFAYDYRNRLVEVRRQSDQVLLARYEYDTMNRRVARTVYDLGSPGSVVERRRYLYDQWNVLEEWGDDADYSSNGPVATYVHGPGIDHPLQVETSVSAPSGAGTYYYHRDARHNVVAVTDAAGTVVETTRYDDYGNFSQDLSIGNPYLFQSRRHDPETGLFYFRNRYYDPATGRFLQRDPVWDPGNAGNQYSFVGNNPVSRVDPLGLKPNKEDAMTLEKYLARVRLTEKRLRAEKKRAVTPEEVLDFMSEHRGSYNSPWAYIYTEKAGWIDMGHFMKAAWGAAGYRPDWCVIGAGYLVEGLQGVFGFVLGLEGTGSSGFDAGGEDLESNSQGAKFGDGLALDLPFFHGKGSFAQQLEAFFKKLGPRSPEEAPDYDSLPEDEEQTEAEYQRWRSDKIRSFLEYRRLQGPLVWYR